MAKFWQAEVSSDLMICDSDHRSGLILDPASMLYTEGPGFELVWKYEADV